MNGKAVFAALIAVSLVFFASMQFYDYTVSLYSLPLIGSVVDFKPVQLLEPYNLFVGAILALLVAYLMKTKRRR